MCNVDKIVTLGLCPDDAAPTSGFTLMMAPGLSPKLLEKVATEQYVQGGKLAMDKKALTLQQVRNDLIGALQANGALVNPFDTVYDTSQFIPSKPLTTYAGERGVILTRVRTRGRLRSMMISAVQCYPLQSGPGEIKIYADKTYTYPVTFVANQVNTFDADNMDGFPLMIGSPEVRIVVDQSTIPFASSFITCKTGCNGSSPNPCGFASGVAGTTRTKDEGYGVNVQFYCSCNYDQILCDLSKGYIGEIMWLKWQANILEEQLRSSRFNNWIIYGREETATALADVESKYVAKWNEMMATMPAFLKQYRDDKDCIVCNGIRWVTTI